jgi:hypothetical protein
MRFQSLRKEPPIGTFATPANTTWELYDNIKYADVYRVLFNDADHDGLGSRIRDSVFQDKKESALKRIERV